MATRKPKTPREELKAKQPKRSEKPTKPNRADDSERDTTRREKKAADTSDDLEVSVPAVVPSQTELGPADFEADASDFAMEDRPNEDLPPTLPDETAEEVIPFGEEGDEQEQPPMSPAELIELLSSPRAAAAIASLTSGFAGSAEVNSAQPMAVRDLVLRPGDSSPQDIQQLPLVRGHEQPAIDLLHEADSLGPKNPEAAFTGRPRSFFPPGGGVGQSSDVQRLVIEIEITLGNAEHVTRIAVNESKREFKLLALAAVEDLKDKFWQFRNEIRTVWGR